VSNFDTIKSITDNLVRVLDAKGIKFIVGTNEEKEVTASNYPSGKVFYQGDEFEENFGEQMKYIEGEFLIRVFLKDTNEKTLNRDCQRWVHNIRKAVTISALNVGDLASTKYVARITTINTNKTIEDDIGVLDYGLQVRYREI
jgi:hypothetical protein